VGGGQAGPGARQAIVRGGRRPFGPEGQVELASGEGCFPGGWVKDAMYSVCY